MLVCSQPAAAGSCERHERPPVPVSRYHGVKGQTVDYICALPGKVRQGKENYLPPGTSYLKYMYKTTKH